jgi:hypothetical protein
MNGVQEEASKSRQLTMTLCAKPAARDLSSYVETFIRIDQLDQHVSVLRKRESSIFCFRGWFFFVSFVSSWRSFFLRGFVISWLSTRGPAIPPAPSTLAAWQG